MPAESPSSATVASARGACEARRGLELADEQPGPRPLHVSLRRRGRRLAERRAQHRNPHCCARRGEPSRVPGGGRRARILEGLRHNGTLVRTAGEQLAGRALGPVEVGVHRCGLREDERGLGVGERALRLGRRVPRLADSRLTDACERETRRDDPDERDEPHAYWAIFTLSRAAACVT